MKLSKSKIGVLTGIFVSAAIAILIAGIFIIGGKDKMFEKSISAKALFDDVNGLAKGNNVWFEGVKIGTVKDVVFATKGVEVQFTIEKKAMVHIHTDTKAKLGSDGLIGNKIVVLYGGSSSSPGVAAGHVFSVEKAVSTEEMMNTLQENNKNLLQITNNFKIISEGLAAGNGLIGKLLRDETLANTMQTTMLTLKKTSVNAEMLTANLSGITGKLNNKGTLTNDLLTDTTVFASLKVAASQLQKVSLTANKVAENLNSTTNALNGTSGPVGVLLNDSATAANLKSTLINLQAGTYKLDENMEALQHNFLLRGFFKKRAREAAKNKVPAAVAAAKIQ